MRNKVALSKNPDPFKASGVYSFSIKSINNWETFSKHSREGKKEEEGKEQERQENKEVGVCYFSLQCLPVITFVMKFTFTLVMFFFQKVQTAHAVSRSI